MLYKTNCGNEILENWNNVKKKKKIENVIWKNIK